MSTLTHQDIERLRNLYRQKEITIEEYVRRLSQGRFERERKEFLNRYGDLFKDHPPSSKNENRK